MKKIMCFITALTILSLPNYAEAKPVSITARSGKEVLIFVHSQYGSRCRGREKARIAVTRKPTNGRISVRKSIELVKNHRGNCYGRKVPGRGVFYKSRKGFRGKDIVIYNRMTTSGRTLFTIKAIITVK